MPVLRMPISTKVPLGKVFVYVGSSESARVQVIFAREMTRSALWIAAAEPPSRATIAYIRADIVDINGP